MRDEYIKQLVAALQGVKRNPDELKAFKKNALLWGATDQEVNEAIRQADTTSESAVDQTQKKGLIERLLIFDIGIHVFLLAAMGFFAYVLMQTFSTSNPPQARDEKTVANQLSTIEATLIHPAYAKTAPIDATKVFSYPAKPITLAISGTPKREIYGFFPYWMIQNQAQVSLDTITDLALFGLAVDGDGNIITTHSDGTPDGGWIMWQDPQLQNFIKRAKAKNISVELTIKSFYKDDISLLVLSDKAQKTFIANALQLMQSKALDGINLDFEYSGTPNKEVTDAYTRMVINLHTELKKQNPKATLSLSTYVTAAAVPGLVDVPALADSIDRYVIMGYDFHTPSGPPGPIAPLQGTASLVSYVQSYLEQVPPEKLILALGYYGYDWIENEPDRAKQRILPYASIMAEGSKHGIQWNELTQTPWYTYTDAETQRKRIVHFENVRSLSLKYDYINAKQLRGVGIWALGYDGLSKDLQLLLAEKFLQ